MEARAGLRILLVEDNTTDVVLVKAALAEGSASPHQLTHVARLDEALGFLARRPPDVVLLDITLPDSVGVRTVERMHKAAPSVPIVVFTGALEDQIGLAAIDAGASDYLSKNDISGHAIRRTIAYVLQRHDLADVQRLRDTLRRYRAMIDAGAEKESIRDSDIPLDARNPEIFGILQADYQTLFEAYVAHLVNATPAPEHPMESLAISLGEVHSSARDLMQLHVGAIESSGEMTTPIERRAATTAARQLAIDMTGFLLEYYRAGRRRPSSGPPQ